MLRDIPQDITNRLLEGGAVEIRATDDGREMSSDNIFSFILPFLAGFLFMIAVQTSGGYLLQAVVEEKENRTMEIILTSSSPNQIMTGKVIGNLSVGLTQLVIWILFGIIGVVVLQTLIPEIQSPQIDLSFLGLMILTFLPAFVMIAAMMATLGATATESREAQQIAGLFTLPIVIPFWFFGVLIESPNSPLAIGLSIFPIHCPDKPSLTGCLYNHPCLANSAYYFPPIYSGFRRFMAGWSRIPNGYAALWKKTLSKRIVQKGLTERATDE